MSAPQERYSFFASGTYDFTDRARFFARATMAESETETVLFGTNAIFGWEGTVPFNPTTDSPLLSTLNFQDTAVVAAAIANPTSPAYANPSFIPTGAPGAQHPVPVELAALLLGRPPTSSLFFFFFFFFFRLRLRMTRFADWMPGWNPDHSLPPRGTLNTNTVWQIEGGFEFDMLQEWTGELYLSHGQSATYNNAGGNLSLARYRDMIRRPDYGRNAVISGNSPRVNPPALVRQTSPARVASTTPTSVAICRFRRTVSTRSTRRCKRVRRTCRTSSSSTSRALCSICRR